MNRNDNRRSGHTTGSGVVTLTITVAVSTRFLIWNRRAFPEDQIDCTRARARVVSYRAKQTIMTRYASRTVQSVYSVSFILYNTRVRARALSSFGLAELGTRYSFIIIITCVVVIMFARERVCDDNA